MTRFDPERHHRRSIRLCEYDYAQPGEYFVTVCTHDRVCSLGEIVDGTVRLSNAGRLVHEEWFKAAAIRPNVVLHPDEFVVMLNHIHGIIRIASSTDNDDAPRPKPNAVAAVAPRGVAAGSLGAIVGQFKSVTTKGINRTRNSPGAPVWQRDYFEHVVRDESDLERIRRYITENPARWTEDSEYPDHPDNCRGEALPRPKCDPNANAVPRPQSDGNRDAAPRPDSSRPNPNAGIAGKTRDGDMARGSDGDAKGTAMCDQGEAPPRPYGGRGADGLRGSRR
jgi:putative transposase